MMGGVVLHDLGASIYNVEKYNYNFSSTFLPSVSAGFAGMFIAQLSIVSHMFLFLYSHFDILA